MTADVVHMLDYLIYGKIIIDNIRLRDGQVVDGVLGGGGPQAAFGARLWTEGVGFLSRAGRDIEPEYLQTLERLSIDLRGVTLYDDILTLRNQMMTYDENEYMRDHKGELSRVVIREENWVKLLSQPLTLPAAYTSPRVIHLVTEFADEPMVHDALTLRAAGATFSLEPLIDFHEWSNRDAIIGLLPQVDLVTPDWLSASSIAGSDDPRHVVDYWSRLGPKLVAIRHGHHGSYVWDADHDQLWHIPPVPIQVIDPTGAGNSYGGGLSIGWSQTQDALLAGCYASVSAAFLVERVGLPQLSPDLMNAANQRFDAAVDAARRL
ncbi:MAG: carbohydrate kinase family protein [Herpetosiphonaceae bacterium]|nr:carbohydrate kinase family protein [Herpetosiphonaceae bacterium]